MSVESRSAAGPAAHLAPATGSWLTAQLALVCLLALLPLPTSAQSTLESLVPLDTTGTIERIDSPLARQLGMFVDEYPGFEATRLWQVADSSFVLEVTCQREGRIVHERTSLGTAQVSDLRARVSGAVRARAPQAVYDQSGRTAWLAGMMALGLGFYSWGVPVGLNADDAGGVGAGLLTAGLAGFIIPFAVAQSGPVTAGMANLSLYGGTRGIFHGILLLEALRGDDGGEDDGQATIGAAVLGSMLETASGFAWAKRASMSPGAAHAIAVAGDYGMLWGIGLQEVSDGNDDILDFSSERGLDVAGLVGAGVGIAGGALFGSRHPSTWGDLEIVRMSGIVGATAGVAIGPDDEGDEVLLSAVLGSAAGLAGGSFLVKGRDFTPGQSLLVDAGAVGGGIIGLGLVLMTEADDGRWYTAGAALGSIGGYAMAYHAARREARRVADAVPRF